MTSTHLDALEIPGLGIELHFGWGLSVPETSVHPFSPIEGLFEVCRLMALRFFNQCLDSRARADKCVTLRGRHHAFPAIFTDRDQCHRGGRAVMEFRISARGAPGSIPIPRGSTCTPNSRHK